MEDVYLAYIVNCFYLINLTHSIIHTLFLKSLIHKVCANSVYLTILTNFVHICKLSSHHETQIVKF
jgi:hypothetical protein